VTVMSCNLSHAVFSRRDGIVDWRACVDRQGRNLEVRSTHLGMVIEQSGIGEVATAIRGFDQPRHACGRGADHQLSRIGELSSFRVVVVSADDSVARVLASSVRERRPSLR